MQVGDLVEGFATNVLGLKGVLTKVVRKEGMKIGQMRIDRTAYYILWSDGTHRKHARHQFTAEAVCK